MENKEDIKKGIIAGLISYFLWGILPVYWKNLSSVESLQIMCNRIVWSFVFALVIMLIGKKYTKVREILKNPRRLGFAGLSGLVVALNWYIYIYAVNSGNLIQASMGYYLNPIISAVLGIIFFKERSDRFLKIAFGIAIVGVAVMMISFGSIPWISLSLAITFALYGFIKKKADLDVLGALLIETMLLTPFALFWLVREQIVGNGAYGNANNMTIFFLIFSGVVTTIPLLCYAGAAIRIPLTTLGFLQYLSPTLQLSLGLFVYKEKINTTRAISFVFIIIALVVYSLGKIIAARKLIAVPGKDT